MRRRICLLLVLFSIVAKTSAALAYPVGPALSLDKLVEQSDLVCKVEALETKPVDDASFDAVTGYQVQETRLAVIALYRGEEEEKEVRFRHYGPAKNELAVTYMPQWYSFEAGRHYLLFAKRGAGKGAYRQLWKQHTLQEDQGLLLCADADPHPALAIREVVWTELVRLLKSKKIADVRYALSHLHEMSAGDYRNLQEFDRQRVLEVIAPLLKHDDAEIIRATISTIGSGNPCMAQDFAAGWLATVGKGHIPGYGTWEIKPNLGGTLYWKELAAIVESDAPPELRALAVRALGRGGAPEVLARAETWIRDAEPQVRQAAALLLADYPDEANTNLLKQLCKDKSPLARLGAAQAIGFGQFSHLLPELGGLVDDADAKVSSVAALSLLSFSLEQSRDFLHTRRAHPEYGVLFVNALAHEDPEPYLDLLMKNIRENKQPESWWGGFVPWGDSWQVLFRYVQSLPAEKLQTSKIAKVFDALEYPAAKEEKGPRFYSSSEPRDLYAFYRKQGLKDRAATFRAACRRAVSYDIDYYFNMVDAQP